MSFLNDIDHFPGSGEREFHDRSREGLLVAVSTGHPETPKAHEPEPDTALIQGFMRESARAKLTI
jgi:hypothetical protein